MATNNPGLRKCRIAPGTGTPGIRQVNVVTTVPPRLEYQQYEQVTLAQYQANPAGTIPTFQNAGSKGNINQLPQILITGYSAPS